MQTYLSILCFDAQFSRKGSAGFRFAASQVSTSGGAWHVETPWEAMSAKHQQAHLETQQERGSRHGSPAKHHFLRGLGGVLGIPHSKRDGNGASKFTLQSKHRGFPACFFAFSRDSMHHLRLSPRRRCVTASERRAQRGYRATR